MAQKKAVVLLAEGFEEIEAVAVIDILRRSGVRVLVAGLGGSEIRGSRDVILRADKEFEETDVDFDAVVLPGGSVGAANLAASGKVKSLLGRFDVEKKVIGAICAAPSVVLAPLGILDQRAATGYPGTQEGFGRQTKYLEEDVIVDGHIVTSRGPATALSFAFAVAELLVGAEMARNVKKAMLQR